MLQTIREHTQGWIAGTIITIIILSFGLWGIHSYINGNGTSNVIAEVNGVDITKEQLTVTYERMRRQAQLQYGTANQIKDEAALKKRALQTLIDVEVLKQASTAQGYLIADPQVDSYLQNMPEFQVDGQFSFERFQEVLATTLLSTSEFLDLIRISLLMDQPKLGIVFTSVALPDEVAYTVSLVNQERDFDYITLPFQRFASQLGAMSADKINAYYNQHKADFMTPEQVTVEYVLLSLKDLISSIDTNDTALKSFYNENINSYSQPTTWKLDGIYIPVAANASPEEIAQAQAKIESFDKALKNGTDFTKLSKQQTTPLISSQDWMTLNQVPAELQKTVSSMTKAGQVSSPLKLSNGFAIVKVMSISEPKVQSFDAVKTNVKDAYARQKAEERMAEMRDRLADLTYEHPETLQTASKALNLPIRTSMLFTREKGGTDITQSKKVRDTAFSNDVLAMQNNSDVIQLSPDTMVVVRVKSHIASALLPLSSVSKQIEEKLRAEESEKQAEKMAQDTLNKLKAGTDVNIVAQTLGAQWNKAGFMGRYVTKIDSAILDLAFSIPNPKVAGKPVTYGIARLTNGYAIVALHTVKDGTIADKRQYQVFAEQVQNSEGLLEYELYKQSQMKAAKIKIY